MKVCQNPTCNFAGLPDDSAFCTECGTPLPAPPPPQQVSPPPPQQVSPPPPQQVSPPPPPQQVSSSEPMLELPNNTSIQIDGAAKVLGRNELLSYLNSLPGVDPMIVSRQHFTILQENDKYYVVDSKTSVQDKASTNHTYLNGKELAEEDKIELNNGDVIDLANTVKLTFRV